MDAITAPPLPRNEPVHDCAPFSAERATLTARLAELSVQHHELYQAPFRSLEPQRG